MILPIYGYGQSVLRETAQDITSDYPLLSKLIKNMFETMDNACGVGLAAPQIGLSIRVVVIDLDPLSDQYPELKDFRKVFINGHITATEGETVSIEEGCLSIPGISESVPRAPRIEVEWMDQEFQPHKEWFEGYAARCIQHEFDHLDGKLFTDRISPIRKQLIKSKLSKITSGQTGAEYKMKAVKK